MHSRRPNPAHFAPLERTSATGTILDDDIRVELEIVPGTGVRLSFTTLSGRSYRVERCASLDTPIAWSYVAGASLVPGTGGVVQVVDSAAMGEPQLFYRVIELAQ